MRKGFTLIEVLAAGALVGVTALAVGSVYGAVARSDARIADRDVLSRLAIAKMEELRATGEIDQDGLSGDFADEGRSDVRWSVELEPSTQENLDVVRVTAERTQRAEARYTAVTLVYRAPETVVTP